MRDQYNRNKTSSLTFTNVDPKIFDQYTYINLEGGESVEYLKGKYVVKNKVEVYTSSDANFTIFSNEVSVVIQNAIDI